MLLVEILTWLHGIDNAILLFINGLHSPFFDGFMKICSDKWIWVPLYSALLWLFYLKLGLRFTLLALACVTVIIFISDQVSVHVVRSVLPRMRPSNPENPISPMVHLVDGYRSGRYGFPSAHAANVFGLTAYCAWMFRNMRLTLLMVAWAVLVSYSRMYLGVHYLGDLLGGALLGFVAATAVYSVQKRLFPNIVSLHLRHLLLWIPSTALVTSLVIVILSASVKLIVG